MYVEIVIIILVLSIILLTFSYYARESRITKYVYTTKVTEVDHPDNVEIEKNPRDGKPCKKFCPNNICNKYKWQMKAYKKCIRCKNKGYCSFPGDKPGVFHCKPCSDKRYKLSCEEQYGCRNRRGRWYAPVDPKYTNCNLCWNE